MIHVSESTKLKEGRGKGEQEFYKPWIEVREVNSNGLSALFPDWKHGRTMHLLSKGELYAYLILRWADNVTDIREQFPLLNKTDTIRIAEAFGFNHPRDKDGYVVMTTDFLVTYIDEKGRRKEKAFSVKDKRDAVFGDINSPRVLRNVEKQRIEMSYWHLRGIDFQILFKEDLNEVLASNIELCVQRYTLPQKFTKSDLLRCLIARKKIIVEMGEYYLQDRMPELIDMHEDILIRYCNKITAKSSNYMLIDQGGDYELDT